jgi:hypothetical protein
MSYNHREPFVPEPDTVIWRYMDDWKFEDLLKRFSEHSQWNQQKPGTRTIYLNDPGQLWFGFPGSFEDDNEGHYPDANENPSTYCDRMAAYMGLSADDAQRRKDRFLATDTASLRDGAFFMAQMCGVSCWHANPAESVDMWRNFVTKRNGVAVRATCRQVENSLAFALNSPARRASPSVCAVGYVDHADFFLPYDGCRALLSIVQESYSYENEVRFVAKSAAVAAIPTRISVSVPLDPTSWTVANEEWSQKKVDYIQDVANHARQAYAQQRATRAEGFRLPVSLPALLSEVVLKPGCDSDYESTVHQLLQQAGCQHVTVTHSSLKRI